jgi:hypothetical protein
MLQDDLWSEYILSMLLLMLEAAKNQGAWSAETLLGKTTVNAGQAPSAFEFLLGENKVLGFQAYHHVSRIILGDAALST